LDPVLLGNRRIISKASFISALAKWLSNSNFCRFCSMRESVSRSSVSRASRSALWRMMPRKRML
jgi:hypothetical protein